MDSAIAFNLDAQAAWRASIDRQLARLTRLLNEQELNDEAAQAQMALLRERLATDKMVVAFVAEFSRGKSELINAIFFADAGRRVLPATPGRTTMCPVELRYDLNAPPQLSLLAIETRLRGLALSDLRPRPEAWEHTPLEPGDAKGLAQALSAVTRTQRVSVQEATALGFWHESQPEDNPPVGADGLVEVPAWRHAIINYPHPLLERGLVVIDTPGLNAIGAEPELTLGLLPTAHAVVFVLGADTGVTRSDLAVWREHLGATALERFVVLNKIDTLEDPLATSEELARQVATQRQQVGTQLQVPLQRVFAVSARGSLTARVGRAGGSPVGALASGAGTANSGRSGLVRAVDQLPALELALAGELLPRQQALLVQSAEEMLQRLLDVAGKHMAERRRQVQEQLGDLDGLRDKSGGKLKLMLERIDIEAQEFEQCYGRLAALRAMQMRMLRAMMTQLGTDALRAEVTVMQVEVGSRPFNLAGRVPFEALLGRLTATLHSAQSQAEEMRQMLSATFAQLNSEFEFNFSVNAAPALKPYITELEQVGTNYGRYFGITQAWRLATPGFAEHFRRMLLSKLRVVFENASGELEIWSKAATSQIEQQARERKRGFTKRREALQRVQLATGELDERINEVQAQDQQLLQAQGRLSKAMGDVQQALARTPGSAPAPADLELDLLVQSGER